MIKQSVESAARFDGIRLRFFVMLSLAMVLGAGISEAQSRGVRSPAERRSYIERPITAGHRHLNVQVGVGGEYVDYYRHYAAIQRPVWSAGSHLSVAFGVSDRFEFGAGIGVRLPDDPRLLPYVSPDRYTRVNREWLPTGLELSRQPTVLGYEYFTNPYLRGRVALLNHAPVYVGFDLAVVLPIAAQSCLTIDAGVPIHIIAGRIMRIETGVFNEFVGCEVAPQAGVATRLWTLMVPLRVLFNITPDFWIGLRTGFETVGYSFDARNFAIPLGLQAGLRVLPRVDVMFNVVAPEFIHTDPITGRNVGLERIGAGIAVQLFLL